MPSPASWETPANLRNLPPSDETPSSTTSSKDKPEKPPLSLDQFLNSHTSQDNESFEDIMVESEKKHRLKYSYLYNEEDRSGTEQKQLLALPSIEEQCALPEKKLDVDTWGYKNKNYIMYVPDGVDPSNEELAEMERKRLEVVYGNTRLKRNPFNEAQSQETINELAKTQAKVRRAIFKREFVFCTYNAVFNLVVGWKNRSRWKRNCANFPKSQWVQLCPNPIALSRFHGQSSDDMGRDRRHSIPIGWQRYTSPKVTKQILFHFSSKSTYFVLKHFFF